jgi:hypothetical protein
MKIRITSVVSVISISTAACALLLVLPEATAQNPQVAQKVAEIKQAAANNKQALARYTWQEQQAISLKGEV